MKNIKYILFGVLLVAILGVCYAYYEFHRKAKDLSSVKADIEISANDLMNAYLKNDAAANTFYLNKTIDVKGKVKSVDIDRGFYTVLLGTDVEDNSISCLIDSTHNEEAKKIQKGNEVTIRGFCTGKIEMDLLQSVDVQLTRCVEAKK